MANLKDEISGDYVYVSVGLTKNLGNYESLRLDASYRRGIREGESLDEAYADAWETVEAQIEAQVTDADSALNE